MHLWYSPDMPTGIYPREPRPEADPLPRFWSKVEKTEGCWLWIAGLDDDGYGRFWYRGGNQPAHRFIFEQLERPLNEGEQALHRCDVRRCVRLDHLFAGTQGDNIRDCWAKRRNAFNARPMRGSQNGNSTLTEAQVLEIRARYIPGQAPHPSPVSMQSLAKEFGVSKFAIQCIVKGVTWRHLLDSVTVVRGEPV